MSDFEQQLIDCIRGGDLDALADYVQAVRPRLIAFIERNLGSKLRRKVESDDVLQDVGAEAVRSLPKMELGDREPFSWLCQIAERKIIDAHRYHFGAQKRDAGREQPLDRRAGDDSHAGFVNMLVKSMTTPSQAFSRNAREARLADAMLQLSEEQRAALRLRYVENLPSKQIAEQLGKSDAAVRVMLTRATQRLQAIMADTE